MPRTGGMTLEQLAELHSGSGAPSRPNKGWHKVKQTVRAVNAFKPKPVDDVPLDSKPVRIFTGKSLAQLSESQANAGTGRKPWQVARHAPSRLATCT